MRSITRQAGYIGVGRGRVVSAHRWPTAQDIAAFKPAAWYRFGQGITIDTGVSQWDDQSGNGRHLKQATATNQPAKQADGSILFDGGSDFLKADAFTLNQPETVFWLGKQVTWKEAGYFFDGNSANTGAVRQTSSAVSPSISLHAGLQAAANTDLVLDTYGIVIAEFNGASSSLQVNNGTATTGNPSTNGAGGFTLGATGAGGFQGNTQVKEIVVYAALLTAAQKAQVIRYLSNVGGLGL